MRELTRGSKIKFVQLGLGVVISLVCLWLALRSVPFAELGQVLRRANYLWLIPSLLLVLLLNLIDAQIWRLLLEERVSLADTFWAYSVGILFNNILPFRLGEPARITVLAAHRNLPVVEVAAAAGLKRLLDVVAVVMMLIGVLPFMTVPLEAKQGALLFGGIAIVVIMLIFGLAKSGNRSEILLRHVAGSILPRYTELIIARWRELVRGLAVLTRPSIGAPAVGWSVLVWGIRIGFQWCVLRAFQPLAGAVEAAFMVAATSLAIAVPAAPGFIGVYQWVGEQSLAVPFPNLYTASSALGIAIVTHLTSYILGTSLGVIGLWYFGRSFMELGRMLSKPASLTESIPGA